MIIPATTTTPPTIAPTIAPTLVLSSLVPLSNKVQQLLNNVTVYKYLLVTRGVIIITITIVVFSGVADARTCITVTFFFNCKIIFVCKPCMKISYTKIFT